MAKILATLGLLFGPFSAYYLPSNKFKILSLILSVLYNSFLAISQNIAFFGDNGRLLNLNREVMYSMTLRMPDLKHKVVENQNSKKEKVQGKVAKEPVPAKSKTQREREGSIHCVVKVYNDIFVKSRRTMLAYRDLVEDKQLSATARILLLMIMALAVKENYCYASNKYLSEKLGLSISSLKNYLAELKNYGFIRTETIKKTNGRGRIIFVVWNEMKQKYLRKKPASTRPKWNKE